MRNLKLISTVLMVTAIYGCSSAPKKNSAVEEARANYQLAQSNPTVQKYATIELKEAEDTLARAEGAFENKEKPAVVEHIAYMAKQKSNIALARAQQRSSEEMIKNSTAQRDKILLQARTAEADRLRSELNAKQTDRGMTISLGDVLFDTNKSQLKPGGAREVKKLAQFLRENPQRNISIEGFTDSQGSEEHNLALSERRANAVKDELVDSGIDAQRITSKGFGESYPVADNGTSAGRQMNRRVEIVISDEGKQVTPR